MHWSDKLTCKPGLLFQERFLNITEAFFCQEITAALAGQGMSLLYVIALLTNNFKNSITFAHLFFYLYPDEIACGSLVH